MKNKGSGLIIILIVIGLIAVSLFFYKIKKSPQTEKSSIVTEIVTPKPISTDNSYDSIETELENTVILNEDLSDL